MRRSPVLLALLALVACGPEPVAPPPLVPATEVAAPQAFADEPASASRIAADVTYLASPELAGRGTGDPGGQAAARFVEKRFRDLGLAPCAGNSAYLQPFSARVGAKVTKSAIVVRGARIKGAAAVTAAVGSASAAVRANAVFVGYGITAEALGWDEYDGADVAGKIAVILDGYPASAVIPAKPRQKTKLRSLTRDFGAVRYKLRNAREHKAAGVVIVMDGDKLPGPPDDVSSMGVPAVVVTRSHAEALFPKVLPEAHVLPYSWMKPVELPKRAIAEIAVEIQPVDAPSWNVIGMVPGRDGSPTKDEVVIVGAHYDHLGHGNAFSRAPGVRAIHPGADDNASGAALMLEVARRFAAKPERPPRSVVFMAFGAEEIGSVGSRHWTRHPTVPIDRVVAMLNADMVGRLRDDRLVIDGVSTSGAWAPLIRRSAGDLHLSITLGGEGFGASDHASFTAVRVPVAFFFTGVHEDYHMPSDTADKINAAGEERIATLVARLALAVAEEPGRMPFVDPPTDPHKGGRGGFKVALGTIPDYAFSGKGLRLDGVRAGGPAARGGLLRGDVIVKVGPHEIGNIHDYMLALGELTAGREVTIDVLRDGKRLSLTVTPAPGR